MSINYSGMEVVMSKEDRINALKKQLTRDLSELLEMEKEREILESELGRKKEEKSTRRGMLESLTEAYFAKIIKIAKEEEEIEGFSKKS